jgi:hypothetical protein
LIRKIVGKCGEELVSLVFGLFLSQKGNIRAETVVLKATCGLMCNQRLSRACLAKENECMFRFGIVNPVDDVVQEIFACALKTALFITAESLASLMRQFSDYCTQLCVPLVKLTI